MQNPDIRDQNAEVKLQRDEGIEGSSARTGRSQKLEAGCQMSEVSETKNDGRTVRQGPLGSRTTNVVADAIARIRSGDKDAYKVIYDATDEALKAFVGRRFGHLGQDFVEEVAIRTHEFAFIHISEYSSDRGASFRTWLFWQARATARHVRREWYGSRFVRYSQARHEAYAVSATGPVDIYEEKRLWRILREETDALPEKERRTVMLHDVEARSHPEIARDSGLTYEQVRYRRRLVLKRLRRRLKERGVRPVPIDTTPVPTWHGKTGTVPSQGPVRLPGTVPCFAGSPPSATRPPAWYHEDRTEPDDDYTTSVTAVLPDEPPYLVGAAAKARDEK